MAQGTDRTASGWLDVRIHPGDDGLLAAVVLAGMLAGEWGGVVAEFDEDGSSFVVRVPDERRPSFRRAGNAP